MLYVSGATYSISHDCVGRLGLSVSELLYMLLVSIPVRRPVRTRYCCLKCPLQIDGRSFVANLIYPPLSSLDLILDMDWFSANHAMINCSKKSIVLPLMPVKPIESICLFLNSIRVGSFKIDNKDMFTSWQVVWNSNRCWMRFQ